MSNGRTYEAAHLGVFVCLWRRAETRAEQRGWQNGLVCRVVTLPCAGYTLHCTCEAARFCASGAWSCPHSMPALRWLFSGGALEDSAPEAGVQGGGSPFAGAAPAAVLLHPVQRDVTGQLSPLVSPLVSQGLSPASQQAVSMEER